MSYVYYQETRTDKAYLQPTLVRILKDVDLSGLIEPSFEVFSNNSSNKVFIITNIIMRGFGPISSDTSVGFFNGGTQVTPNIVLAFSSSPSPIVMPGGVSVYPIRDAAGVQEIGFYPGLNPGETLTGVMSGGAPGSGFGSCDVIGYYIDVGS
jgi:hypothetical protein